MLILFVKYNKIACFFVNFALFSIKAAVPHKSIFVSGPANAIKAVCAGVADPEIPTWLFLF